MNNSYPRFYRRILSDCAEDFYLVTGPKSMPQYWTVEKSCWLPSAFFTREKWLKIGQSHLFTYAAKVEQIERHQLPKECPEYVWAPVSYPKFFERNGLARLYKVQRPKVQRPGVQPVFWLGTFGWDKSANYATEKHLATDHIVKPISRRRADQIRRNEA